MSDLSADDLFNAPASAIAVRPKRKKKSKSRREPRFHVILWNDDDHTYEYVVYMLQELFAYPPEKGFMLAKKVDSTGRAIVYTSTLEKAEIKRDQILSFGPDPWMASSTGAATGPLIATLEKDAEDG